MPRRNRNVATPRYLTVPPTVDAVSGGLFGLLAPVLAKPVTRRAHRNAARRWTA